MSNPTKPDARQVVLRSAQAMIGSAAGDTLDTIVPKINDEIAKLFEDRNALLTDGGTIVYSSTSVTFTESLKLSINSKIAGGSPVVIDLGATTRTISASGKMIYAVINRTAGTAVITDDSSTLPTVVSANQEVFLIAKRVDAGDGTKRLYFRNGEVFSDGESRRLGAVGSSSNGTGVSWIAKEQTLTVSTTSASITFTTAQSDTSYAIFAMMENLTDTNPQFQQVEITAKSTTGFTATWNTPLDTSNYVLSYIIPPKTALLIESSIASSAISSGTLASAFLGMLQNVTDSTPQFQPITITATSFIAGSLAWNTPLDSANYLGVTMANAVMLKALSNGVSSAVLALPINFGATNYAVMATLVNLTDANPKFMPLLITAKGNSNFTVSFPDPTDTSNYLIAYYALSLTT